MLKGINDSLADARALVKLVAGIPAKINLIPFNPWPGAPYECSDWSQIEKFAEIVNRAGYASPVSPRFNEPHTYPELSRLSLNEWAPSGRWTLAQHAAVLDEAPGRIAFRFQARDVNLVMGPPARGSSVPFRVLLDGAAPGDAHGFDVDAGGNGSLADQRLYQLIRQPGSVAESLIEIEFLGAGAEAYCFTFG